MSEHGSCSNQPPEVLHEQEETQVSTTHALTWPLGNRVSMSPAHDSLHGLWPLATSYQFVDRDDEASFVAKDFAAMRPSHLVLILVEMTVPPYSLTPLGVQSRPLTWPVTVCVVIQLVVRYLDVDSTLGVKWYGKFYFAMTGLMWCGVIAGQQLFGFAPIASDGIFLVLFFIFVFLQGLLITSTIVYEPKYVLLAILVFNSLCTLHLYLFVHTAESPSGLPFSEAKANFGAPSELSSEGRGHAGPEPLEEPLAFGLIYLCMTIICAALVFSQLRARRFHHAELEYMHERLRREKERIGYELAIARKAHSVATRLLEGDEGNRKATRSGGGFSSSGPRSVRSVASSAMSSHMSELAGAMRIADETRELEAWQGQVDLEQTMALDAHEALPVRAEERQQRLWATLAELGIRPKSVTPVISDLSDQATLL